MTRVLHLFRRVPDPRYDGIEHRVAALEAEMDGLKDHVSQQMLKLAGDMRSAVKEGVQDGIENYREAQWETRFALFVAELKQTLRLYVRRLAGLVVLGLGSALWAQAGPKVSAWLTHAMGWAG